MKAKKCKECGKISIPRCGTQVYCDGPHTSICVICEKEFSYTVRPTEKPHTCSRECQEELRSKIAMDKMEAHKFARVYDCGVIRWEY